MRSRLYRGEVRHARTRPKKNAFRYPVYYLGLDLDELEEVDRALRVLSYNRPNLVSFWDRDHGPRDGTPLRPWIDAVCAEAGIDLAGGRVMLLSFPRVLSTRFFPVSFWYCFGAGGEPLAVMAEVHNTVRDRHNYLLHNGGQPIDWAAKPHATKAFWVSPFIQVGDVEYEFRFTEPGDRLSVSIQDIVEGSPLFTASISLEARELSDGALLGTVLRHGPISGVAITRILWQALKLFVKRVPYYPYVPAPEKETSL